MTSPDHPPLAAQQFPVSISKRALALQPIGAPHHARHPILIIHAKAVGHAIDVVEVGNHLHSHDDCFVAEPVPAQHVNVRLAHRSGSGLAYSAWPDRIFLVRTDGRLAVAGTRGPFGFAPAIKEVKQWLASYKETGVEPDLPEDAADAGEDLDVATIALRKKKTASSPKPESKPDPEAKEDDDKP